MDFGVIFLNECTFSSMKSFNLSYNPLGRKICPAIFKNWELNNYVIDLVSYFKAFKDMEIMTLQQNKNNKMIVLNLENSTK